MNPFHHAWNIALKVSKLSDAFPILFDSRSVFGTTFAVRNTPIFVGDKNLKFYSLIYEEIKRVKVRLHHIQLHVGFKVVNDETNVHVGISFDQNFTTTVTKIKSVDYDKLVKCNMDVEGQYHFSGDA